MEPASGLSTYCRSCGGYFKIEKAAPAGRLSGLMSRARGKQQPVPVPQGVASGKGPAMPLQISGFSEQDAPMVGRAALLSNAPSQAGAFKEAPRVVVCFECNASHKVAGASTSTICPSCSTYLDLRNIEIKDRTNQRIKTRGNVVVQKKGALLGTSVHCGDLTVHGSVAGSIYAAGEVHLKTDGKIIGEIRCQRFILDRKCEVHCLQPVHAEVVEIHGHVTGHFHATQCIILSRHASLTGSAKAHSISMEPGARLNGQVQVRPPERPERPEFSAALVPG